MPAISIPVSEQFIPHIPAVVMRAGYLYPDLRLAYEAEGIVVDAGTNPLPPNISRDITYLLYREKILADTAGFRGQVLDYLYAPKP